MPATFIPVTGLNLGPVGAVSQSDFPLRTPRPVKSTDTKNIAFGESAVVNSDNTYSSVAQFIERGGTFTSDTPVGIAAENVHTNGSFPLAGSGGDMMPGGYYAPGNLADVLCQGTINVQLNNGTPVSQGTVYIRTALNASIPAGVVGGFEAEADAGVNTTGTATSGSTALTVASGTGIVVGQIVTGTGIADGTSVTAVNGTSVTLSQNTTAALSTTAVNFASTVARSDLKFMTGVVGSDNTVQVTILRRSIA